ncbi:DMT family transporter [Desulfosporosinus meridiei]|uniref:DMT(Drug/metabolite transporter) superfamily permease n=1 Tax=Desulfosporosinus meridiei (strain ATCC BAA-275 / DSM 13257 / KCTC 12902 / NCIMB 13706 / S10) TaxID=768704 RepID=J7IQT5_DESMD|nr:DMT family transporter [Desulfosporosinus meridiei]AFQ42544.1 DMT(drug/metabolite transporter) superfamily permease [Desulfosporosinus meridiei DSM 13257]
MKNKTAISIAILAAALFGISSPVSKLLLEEIPPTLMAALLYLGAGFGMLTINIVKALSKSEQIEAKMTKKEMPYILGMIILDVAAPVCLMIGLTMTTSANVSLLSNFEIVATSLIALLIFKEAIGKRMWIAISLITLASIILSVEDLTGFSFSNGSIFVILACICWGLENNCTRILSLKDPLQIVVVKGFGSGVGSLIIALALKQYSTKVLYLLVALVLGFVSYGLSIYFYIIAQRELGAARTSAYYAVAPFTGVLFSIVLFGQHITLSFIVALIIMIIGAYFGGVEHHKHPHTHEEGTHEHRHNHEDYHHTHLHDCIGEGEHSHVHTHEKIVHVHAHTPDMHHVHSH